MSEEDISYPGRNQRTIHITGECTHITADTSWQHTATGQHPVCLVWSMCVFPVCLCLNACAEWGGGWGGGTWVFVFLLCLNGSEKSRLPCMTDTHQNERHLWSLACVKERGSEDERERQLEGDKCSSSSEIRWMPPAGMLMYLSSAAGINRCCPLAICYNPLYPFSRRNPLGLIVALSDSGTAQGSFFWDDGEGIGKWKGHP